MFCTKCGKELQYGWMSCPYCGQETAVEDEKERKKTDQIADKVLNKITGRDMATIRVSYAELAGMINEYFIQQAADEEELKRIEEKCSKNALNTMLGTTKTMTSKDGKYEFYFHAEHANISNIGPLSTSTAWVHDMQTDTYYQLKKASELKKLSKEVKKLINDRKASLHITVIPNMANADIKEEATDAADSLAVKEQDIVQQGEEIAQTANCFDATSATEKPNYSELIELKKLMDMGIITEEEFSIKKKEILGL